MSQLTTYRNVLITFARNSLVRDMSFRGNFILEAGASMMWMGLNLLFYIIIFTYTDEIGEGTGWGKYQYFVFLATSMFVGSLSHTFFLPNARLFSEQIRTGSLDFALLKPIDTQFLISFTRVEWASMSNFVLGLALITYALWQMDYAPSWYAFALFPFYILCGVAILYSLIISLAATSVWMGRNQSMDSFFFYITTFSRYPMEIYQGSIGSVLRHLFTYFFPILIAINVPARLLAKPMQPSEWRLALFALIATVISLALSRWVFKSSLRSYRSASS